MHTLDPDRFSGRVHGWPTGLYLLQHPDGMAVSISNFGAKILQVVVPDRHGRFDDVVLGYADLPGVLAGSPSLGAFIAPFAGRLAQARFPAQGRTWQVGANEGPHALHGGPAGSRHQVFQVQHHDALSLRLHLTLPAQQTGWPGTLALQLLYRLDSPFTLSLEYEAQALDGDCPVSLTTHAFFNLGGAAHPTIDRHWLQLWADDWLSTDADQVVTGERRPVAGTDADLRQPRPLADLGQVDRAYVLTPTAVPGQARLCARLGCEETGRVMETWSTEPVLQFYTGDKLSPPHRPRAGLCLEPQHFPNAPNCPAFPQQVARPGQPVRGVTRYRFGVM